MTNAIRSVPALGSSFFNRASERFWELHSKLAALQYSRPVSEMWRSFYELTSRIHVLRNIRARPSALPVYAYNGHQHAARMWIDEAVRRHTQSPLLHFDTHHDMGALRRPDRVLSAVEKLTSEGVTHEEGLRALARAVVDHATPVTAGVLGRGVTDVVWALPQWSNMPAFLRRPFLYAELPQVPNIGANGRYRLLYDPAADPAGALPVQTTGVWTRLDELPHAQYRDLKHKRPFLLSQVTTHPSNGDTLGTLLAAIAKGRFVLDIDLDYFMSIDSESGFRRPGPARWPDRVDRVTDYEARLRVARQLLDQRLASFADLIKALRKAGRIPWFITLADSTYMPFATTAAGKAYWEYMPYEFAAYVHYEVRLILARVYRRDGIDAGL